MTPREPEIRPAATVILTRGGAAGPEVLMGRRGADAAFMPGKVVFPGGAVDAADRQVVLAGPLAPACARRLGEEPRGTTPEALAAAAIRELREETGLILGTPGAWPEAPPPGWRGFAATGHRPSGVGLAFVFRAITPPGRPRRFDARFFRADAAAIAGDPGDFSQAEDELSNLEWVPLATAQRHDMPFITEVVLAEIAAQGSTTGPPASVPYFRNLGGAPEFRRIA